jgi:WD40 repeat protein
MQRLQKEDIACASIDITKIGSQQVTLQQWYGSLIGSLAKSFKLSGKFNRITWLRDREKLSPVQWLDEFIEEVLLEQVSHKIAIFIDEIDSIIKISFKDDFFAFIRACYNQRVDNPEYRRLTFCLLGVATPSDLIADKARTPFNIGRAIDLTGFTLEEAKSSLIQGLVEKVGNPENVLETVLDWTGGQPFLTQKLCKLVTEKTKSRKPNIKQLVQKYVIDNWESQDEPEHLRTIRDRILSNEQRTSRLLGLYQQILQQGEIAADDSSEQMELRLSGLVVKQNGKLRVYNRIYEAVFNQSWVNQELANLRPYSEAINAWLGTNRQDESRLLRGQALQDALAWADTQSLSTDEYTFLTASQQKELEAERQERHILNEAKRKAEQLLIEAEQRRQKAEQKRKEAQEGTKIERAGIRALRQFESGGGEIEALLLAMEAGQALQKLVQDGRSLQNYPATSPLLALQMILDHIRERNQFSWDQSEDLLWNVNLISNGEYISISSVMGYLGLWDLSGREIAKFKGYPGIFDNNLSLSPNCEYIATVSTDGTARLWDLSGNQIAQFIGHQDSIRSVRFSPDGQYIATASSDCTARLWDLAGNQLVEFSGHKHSVTSISFSPKGNYIATASMDGTARLWDLSGNQLTEFQGHQDRVWSVSFSPDGHYIATTSSDCTARLWDLAGNLITEFKGHQDGVTAISFSPDGKYIATVSDGILPGGSLICTARLWNFSGNLIAEFTPLTDRSHVKSVSFNSEGKYLAAGSHRRAKAMLWDLSEKQITELIGHQDAVTTVSFSPNGEYIATTSEDCTARLWDLSGNQLAEFSGDYEDVKFSPNGEYIAAASRDSTARLWDLSGNQITQLLGHQDAVWSISFSPNGKYIATASRDGTARLWDLSGKPITELIGHQDAVRSISFSPNGDYILTASSDRTARLWDSSGNQIAELLGHHKEVLSASFSAQGQCIATTSNDWTIRLWDLSGNQIAEFISNEDGIGSASFSPNGDYIATISEYGVARLGDLSGNQIAKFTGHPRSVSDFIFSPNGEYVATVTSNDGIARLWDLSGNQIAEFKGHKSFVWSVSFSPDGRYLATASDDRTARLWRVEGLDELFARGCDWLKYYLASHPEAREKLKVCQN